MRLHRHNGRRNKILELSYPMTLEKCSTPSKQRQCSFAHSNSLKLQWSHAMTGLAL